MKLGFVPWNQRLLRRATPRNDKGNFLTTLQTL